MNVDIKKLLSSRRNRILLLIGFLLLLFLLKEIFFSAPKESYVTSIVKRDDIELNVLANGVLKPVSLVAVGAQTTGRIEKLNVSTGDKVKAGDLLVEIDSTNQENDLGKAEQALIGYQAKLRQQQVQYLLDRAKLARSTKLLKSNSTTISSNKDIEGQVEIDKSQLDALQAQIKQAKLEIQSAQLALSHTKITAPSSGTVLATLVQKGQNINAVQSAPTVVILGNLEKMRVYAQISEADVNKVHAGQDVDFNVVGDEKRIYKAKLERIEPAPEDIRGDIAFNSSGRTDSSNAMYYNGLFTVDNKDSSLRTYMNCEVRIKEASAHNALVIPSLALNNVEGDKAQVLVKKGNQITSRYVTIGIDNKAMVEVKSGLKAGEEVVLSISDNKKVKKLLAPPFRMRVG